MDHAWTGFWVVSSAEDTSRGVLGRPLSSYCQKFSGQQPVTDETRR